MAKHIARKRFGQHFLSDSTVIDRIVAAVSPRAGQYMVEIGPGLAALTQPLVERLGKLTVVELDRDLVERLQKHPQLRVVAADVLTVDFAQLHKVWQEETGNEPGAASDVAVRPRQKLRVVGNLPYNISTPILFHLLDYAQIIEDQHFMLQKEVIDRMVARPSTHAYGRLSVMLQWRYEMESLFDVPPQAFEPPPKVVSSVVRMEPLATVPQELDVGLLSELVQVAFSQRRKLLRHSLGKWLDARGFNGDFDVQRRAEEVPVCEYIGLAQVLNKA